MKITGVSIVIAVLNEGENISKCLDSLSQQSFKGDIEIIISDGGSKDDTLDIIESYLQKNNNIILLDNPKVNQSAGRNLAIKESKYDYVAYIDGHSFADKYWIENIVKTFEEHSNDDTFGVGSVYLNADNSMFTKATDAVMKSILAGANDGHFLNVKTVSAVDNAYACLYRKDVFLNIGGYKEHLTTGEDIELNQRAIKKGYKIYVNPEAKTYYKRRKTLFGFIKQQYRYGYWRALLIKKETFALKPLAPALFLLLFTVGFVLSFSNPVVYEVFNYAVLFYIIAVFYYSSKIGIQKKISSFLCFLISVSLHISYGAGILIGIIFNNKHE